MFHKLADDVYANLSGHKGSVTANTRSASQRMILPGGQQIKFVSIELDRANFQKKLPCELKEIPERLLKVLNDKKGRKPFLYQHNYAHIIQEEAIEILETEYSGLVKTTHQEAKALEIIAQQFKQFVDDTDTDRPQRIIKEYEIEKLALARRVLMDNIKNPPTIAELSKQVGINRQKLKQGFKDIYGSTIYNYVLKTRFDHARALLMTGKLSVKEVAHEVGYENKSFFARKFKERFSILPSELNRSLHSSSLAVKGNPNV